MLKPRQINAIARVGHGPGQETRCPRRACNDFHAACRNDRGRRHGDLGGLFTSFSVLNITPNLYLNAHGIRCHYMDLFGGPAQTRWYSAATLAIVSCHCGLRTLMEARREWADRQHSRRGIIDPDYRPRPSF